MSRNVTAVNWLLGFLGGAAGAALGFYLFFLIARQGLYAMVLPGALVGLGCGFLSGMKSKLLGITCGVAALMLGLLIEWRFAPFAVDKSFAFFITHLQHLKPMTLILITIGALMGLWFGIGREGGVGPRRSVTAAGADDPTEEFG
ncbi:MAG: hypothetical protein ACR2NM_03825 [Bythopirellula sp.]